MYTVCCRILLQGTVDIEMHSCILYIDWYGAIVCMWHLNYSKYFLMCLFFMLCLLNVICWGNFTLYIQLLLPVGSSLPVRALSVLQGAEVALCGTVIMWTPPQFLGLLFQLADLSQQSFSLLHQVVFESVEMNSERRKYVWLLMIFFKHKDSYFLSYSFFVTDSYLIDIW